MLVNNQHHTIQVKTMIVKILKFWSWLSEKSAESEDGFKQKLSWSFQKIVCSAYRVHIYLIHMLTWRPLDKQNNYDNKDEVLFIGAFI